MRPQQESLPGRTQWDGMEADPLGQPRDAGTPQSSGGQLRTPHASTRAAEFQARVGVWFSGDRGGMRHAPRPSTGCVCALTHSLGSFYKQHRVDEQTPSMQELFTYTPQRYMRHQQAEGGRGRGRAAAAGTQVTARGCQQPRKRGVAGPQTRLSHWPHPLTTVLVP